MKAKTAFGVGIVTGYLVAVYLTARSLRENPRKWMRVADKKERQKNREDL